MKQEDIDRLKALQNEGFTMHDEYNRRRAEVGAQTKALRMQCDHRYPDGSSAWEGGFMFSHCKICGENDL